MSSDGASPEALSRMDIHQILEYLPHRYPILLVDRVLSVVPGERIAALKNVSVNEPYFPGHYPHHPVMPGVLIVEAMAQTAAILCWHRQRALQEAGRSRRPVADRGHPGGEQAGHLEVLRGRQG